MSEIDVIVVCTPAPVHPRNVRDAAEHGLDVLCEKPFGMNEAEMVERETVTQYERRTSRSRRRKVQALSSIDFGSEGPSPMTLILSNCGPDERIGPM